jgi:hypothetical protein
LSGIRPLAALLLMMTMPAAAHAASQGGSYRLWPHGARELAMGGAASLFAPGLESLFQQPASLVGMEGWSMGASVERPTGGVELQLASLAVGRGLGHRSPALHEQTASSRYAAALAFQQLGATLADDSDWGEWTLALGAAWSPRRWLSAGLRGSYARGGSEDGRDEGQALAFSGGLRAVFLTPGLELGFLAEDIVQRFRWQDGPAQRRAPSSSFSAALRLPYGASAEILGRWREGSLERYALGLEWSPWIEHLSLRGGLIAMRRAESRLCPSAGFGVMHRGLRLDYGFRFEEDQGPGSLHRLSLLWTGGSL